MSLLEWVFNSKYHLLRASNDVITSTFFVMHLHRNSQVMLLLCMKGNGQKDTHTPFFLLVNPLDPWDWYIHQHLPNKIQGFICGYIYQVYIDTYGLRLQWCAKPIPGMDLVYMIHLRWSTVTHFDGFPSIFFLGGGEGIGNTPKTGKSKVCVKCIGCQMYDLPRCMPFVVPDFFHQTGAVLYIVEVFLNLIIFIEKKRIRICICLITFLDIYIYNILGVCVLL